MSFSNEKKPSRIKHAKISKAFGKIPKPIGLTGRVSDSVTRHNRRVPS